MNITSNRVRKDIEKEVWTVEYNASSKLILEFSSKYLYNSKNSRRANRPQIPKRQEFLESVNKLYDELEVKYPRLKPLTEKEQRVSDYVDDLIERAIVAPMLNHIDKQNQIKE